MLDAAPAGSGTRGCSLQTGGRLVFFRMNL
jgi:hypothetical protein